jgi:hypothetical protein
MEEWHPDHDEVEHIREELRPLLRQMAQRDRDVLAAEQWRREIPV